MSGIIGSVDNYLTNNPYAQNIGQAVGGVGGLVGMYQNIGDEVNRAKDINYEIPNQLMSNNPYEKPMYNLGRSFTQASTMNADDYGKGLAGQSALQGMGAGAQIGSLGGPVGMAIGAGVGAIVGGISGAIGRGKAKRKAEEKMASEELRLENAQTEYNTQLTGWDQRMDARERYQKRLQNRRRAINRVIG